MLKVLIVDDELLARLALKTAIPWEENGFEVVAEAEDGITGFHYVQEYQPDIVLTDISMPGMNGVELIKKTKQLSPDTEIIILSCHNDFEYVKEGMRLGAADYILKLSMSMDELLQELLKLKEKILKNNRLQKQTDAPAGKEKWAEILFSLVTQEDAYEETVMAGRQSGLLNEERFVILAVIAVDSEEKVVPNYERSNRIEQLAEAVMSRYKLGNYITIERNKGVILCQAATKEGAETKKSALKTMLEELIGLIADYHSVYASAGLGIITETCRIRDSYLQAYEALSMKFYTGPGKVHQFIERKQKNSYLSPDAAYRELLKAVEEFDLENIMAKAENWIDEISINRYPDIPSVKKDIHELLFKIDAEIVMAGDESVNKSFLETAYHKIQKQNYLHEIKETLNQFLEEVGSFVAADKDRAEIMRAKKYVSQYYADNIKVSDVAEHVNMSANYFSHLFKKETGSAFTDYLNEFRIEKAKLLLMTGRYKVYEVAFAVGFQDENYFIRRFKKQTG